MLQSLHKLSVMDGWQEIRVMPGQEGANAGPAAVPASAARPAWITSVAALTCLLQYAEYARKYAGYMQENMLNICKKICIM